ncbi:MAG: NAD(P)-dependent oxidoreductase [Alphaproteobacteria bacterium]
MAQKMLKFVSIDQQTPDKRAADDRREDFGEIYQEFAQARANDQAARCSQCGVPYCQVHCPLQNNIPDWLKLTAEGRLEEAYQVSAATNTMPEICGRICPQDRLCEGNCVIEQAGHGAVTIGAVEKYITETAWDQGWIKPNLPAQERDQSVGIIGAGPAGLAAAEQLRAEGYQVHVYDRYDRVGGLLIYGIPNFKLEKDVVARREQLYRDQGVTFHMNFQVGKDATLDELRDKHDAVLIATGVYKAREINAPGVGLGNVVDALDYLTASNRNNLGDKVAAFESGDLNADGKDIVVVGGGDTAMDCVRTAIRQGAKTVKCLYRRDRENMPGSMREVTNAEEEGVEFVWLTAPKAFIEGKDQKVGAVRAVSMQLGLPDQSGRRSPEEIDGSDHDMHADLVIKALGFDPEDLPTLFGAKELKVSRWGTIDADFRTQMTSIDGVFAAGDIVRGASLVVWGIRDGRDAATAMHEWLQSQSAAIAAE